MALTNLNKLFVRVTDAGLRNAVITKSETDNKIYFLTTTHEIITHGAAYGLSTDVQAQIANIKSILKSFDNSGHGTEDSVKKAIDAVQAALDAYKADNDAKRALLIKTVVYNAAEKTIDFTQENNEVQHINVSDIIGTHIVKGSSYDEATNKLTITFSAGDKANTDVPVDIDLGKLLDINDVVSSNETYFTVSYAGKKLTITPVTKKVTSGEEGLADAKDVKTYVDSAVNGATRDLQGKIDTINGRIDTIQGEETVEGSINKALKDAKEYADGLNSTTNTAITNEVANREAADQALYGAEIPTENAATISGNTALIGKLATTLESEKNARETADQALYGGVIPADGASTISGNASHIAALTEALADPATFWEDYTA